MFSFLKRKKKAEVPLDIVIHQSFIRGWPRAPSIELKTFPLTIKVSQAPQPTHLPIDIVSYTFFDTDEVQGLLRATYLLDIEHNRKNVPGFIWVFLL